MKKLFRGGNLSPSRIPVNNNQGGLTGLTELKTKSISEIAEIIQNDWKDIYFGAAPYLDAMHSINNINDRYMFDDGRTVVAYFLSNASKWKGPVAKQIKAELNRRLKTSRNQMAKGGTVKVDKFINPKFAKWVLDAKKGKKNIAIDYYDNDQLSAWTISPSGKLMQERTFDYNKESDVMHDIDEARKLIFVDQAFRCGGQPKKMKSGGQTHDGSKEITTFNDEIIEKAKLLSDYQFNKWLQENYPKLFKQVHMALLDEMGYLRSKRFYFLRMALVKPELAAQIQNGDKVTILLPSGLLGTGIATIKTRGRENTWTLNMGGAHGTPKVADETNIVAIRKSSNNNDDIPAAQMADGGRTSKKRYSRYFYDMVLYDEGITKEVTCVVCKRKAIPIYHMIERGTILGSNKEEFIMDYWGHKHCLEKLFKRGEIIGEPILSPVIRADEIMQQGGRLSSYRSILESIPNRKGISQQAVEFSRQMLEDAEVDEIPIDNPDVQLLLQKLEAYPLIDTIPEPIAPEPVDAPPSGPLPPANRKMLETRLRIIKKMIAKNPENKTLSLRAKIIQKMISKLKE